MFLARQHGKRNHPKLISFGSVKDHATAASTYIALPLRHSIATSECSDYVVDQSRRMRPRGKARQQIVLLQYTERQQQARNRALTPNWSANVPIAPLFADPTRERLISLTL